MMPVNLMYHDIVADSMAHATGFWEPGADHYKIDKSVFTTHLKAVNESLGGRCQVGLIHELGAESRPGVTLTFDDGGIGAMAALECLAAYGWKGHFLIATGFVDQPGFLTRSDLRELRRCGHVVGTHSHTHISNMKSRPEEQVLDEWSKSIQFLEDTLGAEIDVASVPYGSYSPRVAALAARAGIRHLFTSEPVTRQVTIDTTEVYGRYSITRKSDQFDVTALIENRRLQRQSQWAAWNARKLTKSVLGPGYARIRGMLRPD